MLKNLENRIRDVYLCIIKEGRRRFVTYIEVKKINVSVCFLSEND